LGDVPVLAELAGEVASGCAERQHTGSRVELVERLLLDWVDAETRRAPVGREHHGVARALSNEARATLTFMQAAVTRAQVALDAAVVQPVPVAPWIVTHAVSRLTAIRFPST